MPKLAPISGKPRFSDPFSMPSSLSAPSSDMSYYTSRTPSVGPNYYDPLPGQAPPAPMNYDPYAVAPPPLTIPTNNGYSLPAPTRASSGAWSPDQDQTLVAARAQGMNWAAIQQNHFADKTPNACRKRHERLMEKKGADDWDARKLEIMAREYMTMRKEIWGPLAQRVGEKWNVVEAKCMSNGLKNLQSASRHFARRERMEAGQPVGPYDDHDDSGVSGIDGLDEPDQLYSSPSSAGGTGPNSDGNYPVQHQGSYGPPPGGYYHSYSNSLSTQGGPPESHSPSPYLGHPARMSSVDMGIDALINPASQT